MGFYFKNSRGQQERPVTPTIQATGQHISVKSLAYLGVICHSTKKTTECTLPKALANHPHLFF